MSRRLLLLVPISLLLSVTPLAEPIVPLRHLPRVAPLPKSVAPLELRMHMRMQPRVTERDAAAIQQHRLPSQLPSRLPSQLPSRLPCQLPSQLPSQLPGRRCLTQIATARE